MRVNKYMYRLVILTSHPIQYQIPLFRAIAADNKINLTVFFRSDKGIAAPAYDSEFGQKIQWDIPLREGYHYIFTRNLRAVFWALKKQNPDTLIIYGWNSFFNIVTFLIAKTLNMPVIFYGENPLNNELRKNILKIFFKKIFLRYLFRYTNVFLYIGEENKRFYEYYGVSKKKLFFAPYAVNNERFIADSKSLSVNRKALRKKLGIEENDVVILFVGKLIEKKRPMDLLRAYQQLITNNKQPKDKVHVLYVGDGVLRRKLEQYAKKYDFQNIHFVGFKNQTEIWEYYVLSDILVLPSGFGETWGLVVNEAMCFGLPVIVSDTVGCGTDLVKDGKNGFVFSLGDINNLAVLLATLVSNAEKRKRFGKKSLEIIAAYSYKEDLASIKESLEFIKLRR